MVEKSGWVKITEANPDHSAWYIERFEKMAAEGNDLVGEARLIDAMAPRDGHILDAGCGPGRVGSYLADRGHRVVGADVDPILIEAAKKAHANVQWFVADLAELDLSDRGVTDGFDVIVCAGNVMTFLAPSTRQQVLGRMRTHLVEGGRIVIGFGANRGYEFTEFFTDARAAGLVPALNFSTWDMHPLTEDSDFLVTVLVAVAGSDLAERPTS